MTSGSTSSRSSRVGSSERGPERLDRLVVDVLGEREQHLELVVGRRGLQLAPHERDQRVAEAHRRPRQLELGGDVEARLLAHVGERLAQRVVVERGEGLGHPGDVGLGLGLLLLGQLVVVVVPVVVVVVVVPVVVVRRGSTTSSTLGFGCGRFVAAAFLAGAFFAGAFLAGAASSSAAVFLAAALARRLRRGRLLGRGFAGLAGDFGGRFRGRFGAHRPAASRMASGYRGVDIAVDL